MFSDFRSLDRRGVRRGCVGSMEGREVAYRWTKPRLCMYDTASRICVMMWRMSAVGNGPSALRHHALSTPRTVNSRKNTYEMLRGSVHQFQVKLRPHTHIKRPLPMNECKSFPISLLTRILSSLLISAYAPNPGSLSMSFASSLWSHDVPTCGNTNANHRASSHTSSNFRICG